MRLTFAPTTFTYGAQNTLTIVGVRDMAGNEMDPNIATSGSFEVRYVPFCTARRSATRSASATSEWTSSRTRPFASMM